ncbi:MAG TPA: hypothetical protein ENN87_13305 [Phycisphaerales bacterium]|nr:hypothetical protein [Phycisphaerales bacterium]
MAAEPRWRLNRELNVSVLVQVGLLGALIVGSWMNLQRQLDLLGRDVSLLLERQKEVARKIEQLQAASISHEVRLGSLETQR